MLPLLKRTQNIYNTKDDLTITRPESVLTGRTDQDLENGKEDKAKTENTSSNNNNRKDRSPTRIADLKERKGVVVYTIILSLNSKEKSIFFINGMVNLLSIKPLLLNLYLYLQDLKVKLRQLEKDDLRW